MKFLLRSNDDRVTDHNALVRIVLERERERERKRAVPLIELGQMEERQAKDLEV